MSDVGRRLWRAGSFEPAPVAGSGPRMAIWGRSAVRSCLVQASTVNLGVGGLSSVGLRSGALSPAALSSVASWMGVLLVALGPPGR